MPIDPRAGKPADPATLTNIPRLISSYYALKPDAGIRSQRVSFGTSGHRGSSFDTSFNENHILAITQAICAYRHEQGTTRPIVSRHGYACALGTGADQRTRSAGGKWR